MLSIVANMSEETYIVLIFAVLLVVLIMVYSRFVNSRRRASMHHAPELRDGECLGQAFTDGKSQDEAPSFLVADEREREDLPGGEKSARPDIADLIGEGEKLLAEVETESPSAKSAYLDELQDAAAGLADLMRSSPASQAYSMDVAQEDEPTCETDELESDSALASPEPEGEIADVETAEEVEIDVIEDSESDLESVPLGDLTVENEELSTQTAEDILAAPHEEADTEEEDKSSAELQQIDELDEGIESDGGEDDPSDSEESRPGETEAPAAAMAGHEADVEAASDQSSDEPQITEPVEDGADEATKGSEDETFSVTEEEPDVRDLLGETVTAQFDQLDSDLDALEQLVASIEESLLAMDDEPLDPADGADAMPSEKLAS